MTKATYFTKLHNQLYKDPDISEVIILLHKDKLDKNFFLSDDEICKKVITTLGFFDMLCHLYANRFLGKSEYEYFCGEMHLVTHNESVISYLLHLERENVADIQLYAGERLRREKSVSRLLRYNNEKKQKGVKIL
jgi:hypothetical protein